MGHSRHAFRRGKLQAKRTNAMLNGAAKHAWGGPESIELLCISYGLPLLATAKAKPHGHKFTRISRCFFFHFA